MKKHFFSTLAIALFFVNTYPLLAYSDGYDYGYGYNNSRSSRYGGRYGANNNVNCQPLRWNADSRNGDRYSFGVFRQCTVSGISNGDISALRDFYIADRKSSVSQVHSSQEINNGVKLDLTEVIKTEHGNMTIRSLNYFTIESGSSFLFKSQSVSVRGEGNAKYTENVQNQIEVSPSGNGSYTVTVGNIITVRKPVFAPRDFFIREVKAGLQKDIMRYSDLNNRKVADNL